MPLDFFNVHDGQHPLEQDPPDTDGTDLPGPEEARSAAVVLAAELLKDLDGKFWSGGDWTMEVTDEQGATVCSLRFSGTAGTP
jgi:hypothetical protein